MAVNQRTDSILLLEIDDLINNNYFLDLNYIYESLDNSEKDIVDKIGNRFKTKIKTAKDKESLIEIVKSTCDDILEEMNENPVQISIGAFLVLLAVILNTAIAALLQFLLPSLSLVNILGLTSTCVAPIVEETVKRLSVKTKSTGYHYLLFNLMEASSYINMGVSPLLRIPALIMHFLNTLIHKRADTLNKIKKDSDFDKSIFTSTIGLHAAFNISAVLLPQILGGGIALLATIIFTFAAQLYQLSNMQKETKTSNIKKLKPILSPA